MKGVSFLGPVSICSSYSHQHKSVAEAVPVYTRNSMSLSCAPPGSNLRVTRGNGPVCLHPSKTRTSTPSLSKETVPMGNKQHPSRNITDKANPTSIQKSKHLLNSLISEHFSHTTSFNYSSLWEQAIRKANFLISSAPAVMIADRVN